MPETKYLVRKDSDSAQMRVIGRASYLNCMGIGDFFDRVIDAGIRKIYIDCAECTGMDSTFLGIITGAALKLLQASPKGTATLLNLNERNLELIENLGLDNLVKVENQDSDSNESGELLENANASQDAILKAHVNLAEASPSNKIKFEDVIKFLKKEAESKNKK